MKNWLKELINNNKPLKKVGGLTFKLNKNMPKQKPQKTVSFDKDIFDYIEKNRDRIKFSDYMNQLLSDQIKSREIKSHKQQ